MLFLIIIFKEQAPYSSGAIYPLSKKKSWGCNFWVIGSVQWVSLHDAMSKTSLVMGVEVRLNLSFP
jgi:hypothetical protein